MVKRKSSLIWKYFSKDELGRSLATCMKCRKVYKTSENTSNLMDHLKRAHGKRTKKGSLNKCAAETSSSFSTEAEDTSLSPLNESSKKHQKQITLKRFLNTQNIYSAEHSRKKELDLSLVKMICIDMQPFNVVNDVGFQMFCQKLDPRYQLPSCTTLKRNMVTDLYDTLKLKLRTMLGKINYVAITTDVWTCSYTTESYLTLTCHFVDSGIHSCILKTEQIKGSHTAVNLAEVIEGILKEWRLTEKVVCAVTDNASTMVATCNILNITQLGCFAHTINLVVEGFNKTENLSDLIKKVKSIVAFFKESSKASDLLKKEQENRNLPTLKLLQDVSTWWNSVYYMLKHLIEIGDSLTLAQLNIPEGPQILSIEEKEVIMEVIKVLAPFEVATKQISGTYVTISLIIPIVTGLYHTLNKIKADIKTFLGLELYSQLLASVNKRLCGYESKFIPKVGTILDPRFKKNGFRISGNALTAHAAVQKMAQASIALSTDLSESNVTVADDHPSTSNEKEKKLISSSSYKKETI